MIIDEPALPPADDFRAFCRAELANAWAVLLDEARIFSVARGGVRWPIEEDCP